MESILAIIEAIARGRTRGESGPLLMLRELDGAPGERISHLPVEAELGQAWQALTGEPFRPHQAQALTGLRRGEPVAICANGASISMSAYLMLFATLYPERYATGLLLAPDDAAAQRIVNDIGKINNDLPAALRLPAVLVEPGRRADLAARIQIATPEALHNRLLRHHDRAWATLWAGLRLVVLPNMHEYHGIAGAHLGELLHRLRRIALAHCGQPPGILATLYDLGEVQPALSAILGTGWRIVGGDDIVQEPVAFAVWHGPLDRLRESAEIAVALTRQGYRVHIHCQPLEATALAPMIDDVEGITCGPQQQPAAIVVVAGYPGSHAAVRRLLRSGSVAVVLVLGELPYEQMLAHHTEALLSDPPTRWPAPPANAYVMAQHLLCAASELPLTEAEVVAWGAADIVARQVEHGQLIDLPDPEVAWKPTSEAGDPYLEFSMLSSSGAAITTRNEKGAPLASLDPTCFERWTFLNAALPPGAGGLRVTQRDESNGLLTLRLESNGRRTYPLRRCTIAVREERESRVLRVTRRVGMARVLVEEEIYASREAASNSAPAEVALRPTLETRWVANACWIDLPQIQVLGQLIGWCLAAALPLRTLTEFTNIVPAYDHESKRLYLIDAQPGGNGLAAWVYRNIEELLPLAYDIALACRTDPLLEPLARVDMDWLLPLLSTNEQPRAQPTQAEQPRVAPATYAPEPAQPSITFNPAPQPATPEPRAAESKPPANEQRQRPSVVRPGQQRLPIQEPPPAQPPTRSAPPVQPPAQQQPSAQPPVQKQPPQPSPRTAPPAQQQPPVQKPPPAQPREEPAPNASAMIERLKRQRQQREAQQAQNPAPQHAPPSSTSKPAQSRFAAGDRIFCLPYGDGTVTASWFEDDRELLAVEFPEYGSLRIDPALSLVRKLEEPGQAGDEF